MTTEYRYLIIESHFGDLSVQFRVGVSTIHCIIQGTYKVDALIQRVCRVPLKLITLKLCKDSGKLLT